MTKKIAALLVAVLASYSHAFDLQGHRGARGLLPENSLPGFAKALEIGVDTLELDLAITKDDVVVITHDPLLNPDFVRGPDGKWLEAWGPPVRELTYAELSKYDVGRIKPESAYAKRFSTQQPIDGTRIPKLADLFALVKKSGDEKVRFNIEIKISPLKPGETLGPDPFAKAVVDEIRKAGMAGRSNIQSFDWRVMQVSQKLAPEIPTAYLTAQQRFLDNVCTGPKAGSPNIAPADCEQSPWTAGFQLKDIGSVPKMVKAAGGKIWSPEYRDVDAAKLKEARDLGLKVIVWTVNDPVQIAKMLDLGVDGIISDRPDLVREEMNKRSYPKT